MSIFVGIFREKIVTTFDTWDRNMPYLFPGITNHMKSLAQLFSLWWPIYLVRINRTGNACSRSIAIYLTIYIFIQRNAFWYSSISLSLSLNGRSQHQHTICQQVISLRKDFSFWNSYREHRRIFLSNSSISRKRDTERSVPRDAPKYFAVFL